MNPISGSDPRNLLVALLPDARVRAELALFRSRCRWPQGHGHADPARLHMTLVHLGLVAPSRIPQVQAILRSTPMQRLELVVHSPARPRPLHELRVRPTGGALREFRERLGERLRAAGFDHRGGNRPHVTLSYRADAMPPAESARIGWVADGFLLIWSQLQPDFPKYRHVVLEHYAAVDPAQLRLF
jgi:2'-5' RNA ligase